jgi:hypothetical protein
MAYTLRAGIILLTFCIRIEIWSRLLPSQERLGSGLMTSFCLTYALKMFSVELVTEKIAVPISCYTGE